MADLIRERWGAVISKTGRVDRSVPQSVLDIVNWCVAPKAEDRPHARELRERIENLHLHIMAHTEDDSYQIVFTDMVQASERHLIPEQVTKADLDPEDHVDEDGIPF